LRAGTSDVRAGSGHAADLSGVPMNKEMIISSGDHETRVAILEDDQVVEVFIEREKQRGVVGNVYKGPCQQDPPGMQSVLH
jgi:Ribonuclease G/E